MCRQHWISNCRAGEGLAFVLKAVLVAIHHGDDPFRPRINSPKMYLPATFVSFLVSCREGRNFTEAKFFSRRQYRNNIKYIIYVGAPTYTRRPSPNTGAWKALFACFGHPVSV